MLTAEQQAILLRLARRSLYACVRGDPMPAEDVTDPGLQEMRGAFVTLHKQGELRGCIGLIEATRPLFRTVIDMARAAALEDPRFPPVRPDELEHTHIEISVLSPVERIADAEQIQVGTHGLIIRKGGYSGLLLPQVAAERGWTRLQFLQQTCLKAGLPPNAWQQDAELSVFSAEVFAEDPVA